jgi:hypothetical protein
VLSERLQKEKAATNYGFQISFNIHDAIHGHGHAHSRVCDVHNLFLFPVPERSRNSAMTLSPTAALSF